MRTAFNGTILHIAAFFFAMNALARFGAFAAGSDEFVRFDFESGDLQEWKIVEGKFGQIISDRSTYHNLRLPYGKQPYNKQGRFFLSTLETPGGAGNDTMTGVIESPVFLLKGPRLSFLVGGGNHPGTYVALCSLDGTEILKARGKRTEVMERIVWDAPQCVGRKVFLRIVDAVTAGWGHATFDDFAAAGVLDPKATEQRLASRAPILESRLALAPAAAARSRGPSPRVNDEALAKRNNDAALSRQRDEAMNRLMNDPALLARGETRAYRGEHLAAISLPLGGIGAGCIQIDGNAGRHAWQIFNNFSQAFVPHSFFAVLARPDGGETVVRALQTAAVGHFDAMTSLTFRGEYPFGWYDFEDPALPVAVGMEAFSPLIPLNEKDSAIPCAIFSLTARNVSAKRVTVSFLATQQNAAGYTGTGKIEGRRWKEYGGNRNRVSSERRATILHLTRDGAASAVGAGDMALAVLDPKAGGVASWTDLDTLKMDWAKDGALRGEKNAGPSPPGETIAGALATAFALEPGAEKTVRFVLAWYFPNAAHGGGVWRHEGNMYANWYGSALDVAGDVIERIDDLTRSTRLFHDTFYDSNLPRWLLDRVSSQVAALRSKTCFWAKDGFFGGWEGCNAGGGCCAGNCDHVWHYAQAHARLFPSIARRMREQALAAQRPDGSIPMRLPGTKQAMDGQCGEILEAYREHLLSANRQWLDRHWTGVKRAMEFVISTWDDEEDGMLSGPQHNTLDCELSGCSSWLGSMYLAALAATEKMALLEGDDRTAARVRRIRESGRKKQNEALWNGEYYIQIPDAKPQLDYGNGCHIDQLLGQWWARQIGLDGPYPADRSRRALESLFANNFQTSFRGLVQAPRKFVDEGDAAMKMITWPHNDRPAAFTKYADEVMSGFEYSAAAAMVQAGLVREGFTVVKAASDRYDGRRREGLAGKAWGYSGNPFGDDECGKFYARAMSVWSTLLACQGFIYDGPAGVLGFKPVWSPEDHASLFTGAQGWGRFTQARDGRTQVERIEIVEGDLDLRAFVFEIPEEGKSIQATAQVDGRPTVCALTVHDREARVAFDKLVKLRAGKRLEIRSFLLCPLAF